MLAAPNAFNIGDICHEDISTLAISIFWTAGEFLILKLIWVSNNLKHQVGVPFFKA
ncbi:predicted protein [Histoplasma mississippiense (nom. inval.)]|uniref:predicted protein n=1 Tax=Ajellomyces capsulatus (strain NAm1 / WU24) TaxID=2059318 RepID=UPI000157C760|nr:predicted protein [Histoplasma mississippiense (nom. inval.)]EDN08431.1 predicted protein [Histoplasma mississippiense (nom. inval.)]